MNYCPTGRGLLANHMFARRQRPADRFRVQVMGQDDVHQLDGIVGQKLWKIVECSIDSREFGGQLASGLTVAPGKCDPLDVRGGRGETRNGVGPYGRSQRF